MSAADLAGFDDLADRERAAVEELLFRLADDEFVLAERYTEWQVESPTLESDLALANLAQDELGHARIWYDALGELGYDERELVWERDPDAFLHSTLLERPWEDGDWADAVVRGFLYDEAEKRRLSALQDAPYRAIVDPIEKIQREEDYHREHAQSWLERLCEGETGRANVQRAVDRLYPDALTLFVPAENEAAIRELGLRDESLEAMRDRWLQVTASFLEGNGVDVPFDPDDDLEDRLPAHVGRDGDHTPDWQALYDDYTHTYRELDRSEVRTLRGE